MKSNILGFLLMVIGGILASTTNIVFIAIALVGMFMFASLPYKKTFIDYVTADTNEVLFRKRHYIMFLPFYYGVQILTLGRADFLIVRNDEYFKATIVESKVGEPIKISRKDYIAIRNEQRKIYSTQQLSKEFMQNHYTIESIGLKRKKNRLIAVSVLIAFFCIGSFSDPSAIYMSLICLAAFVPMLLLWIPEYKDAKILHEAYNRTLHSDTQSS